MPNIELWKNPCRLHLSVLQLLDAENLQKKLTENLLNSVMSWLNANSSVLFLRDQRRIIYCRM